MVDTPPITRLKKQFEAVADVAVYFDQVGLLV